ncbi:MAG TPA: ribbon-helix-helix protein, CopG family [Bosea sp. (in: a-proteobacteria)]|jgi:hypothetical protein|uniref:ribbon-helix-helix protein, CopG family n=1 Tax=Bosea sp. (in: a-proteobacteria) TaxID=1871050 RepID=UPI002DDD113E|nr:ribbon-helix-helix protein, CopG family [Bosea sp. (in: a-proteobacteria)]HEV2555253.1 ribbon-helix-helix protein, CopG family [Bosea sp. (in: a-proteobacteria)]
MRPSRARRTEQIFVAAEPELRAAIEAEAARRDTSMSSAIRALIRSALASQAGNLQGATS